MTNIITGINPWGGSDSTAVSVAPGFQGTVTVVTDAATIGATQLWDMALGDFFTLGIGGDRTLNAPGNITAGRSIHLKIKQAAGGPHTVAFGANILFPFSEDPVLSVTENDEDILTFLSFDGTNVYCVSALEFG